MLTVNYRLILKSRHLCVESDQNLPHFFKPSSEPGSSVPYLYLTLDQWNIDEQIEFEETEFEGEESEFDPYREIMEKELDPYR